MALICVSRHSRWVARFRLQRMPLSRFVCCVSLQVHVYRGFSFKNHSWTGWQCPHNLRWRLYQYDHARVDDTLLTLNPGDLFSERDRASAMSLFFLGPLVSLMVLLFRSTDIS